MPALEGHKAAPSVCFDGPQDSAVRKLSLSLPKTLSFFKGSFRPNVTMLPACLRGLPLEWNEKFIFWGCSIGHSILLESIPSEG